MKTTRRSKINENALRSMLRKEISKLLEVEGDQEAPEQEEQPEEEPQEEEGLNPKLEAATSSYIRRLKDSGVQIGTEEITEMLSSVIERFADTSEEKLNILKSIKINIVR